MKAINTKKLVSLYKAYRDTEKRYCSNKNPKYSEEYKERFYAARDEYYKSKAYVTLGKAIKESEGRSSARLITVTNIIDTLIRYENHLDIHKKDMEGISIRSFDYHAQKFPSAYKYTPVSTQFSAEYIKGSWRITAIYRGECTPKERKGVVLPENTREAILAKYE